MKSINVLMVFAVILFDLMAAYKVFTYEYVSDRDIYNQSILEAEQCEKDNLCKKAIDSYKKALELEDSYDVRMKISDLYDKGYRNREFDNLNDKYEFLEETISKYPDQSAPYEQIIERNFFSGKFRECADSIKLAKKNNIKSDYVDEAYETIRHMYSQSDSDYTNVSPLSDQQYLCWYPCEKDSFFKDCNHYESIDSSGNIVKSWDAFNVSPQSENLFFVKQFGKLLDENLTQIDPDQTDNIGKNSRLSKGFSKEIYTSVESTDGKRVSYLSNNLESSSGFGNGLICCKNNKSGDYEYYDANGNFMYGGYKFGGKFNDGISAVKKDLYEIIGTDGKSKTDREIDNIILNGLCECSVNQRMFIKFKGDKEYTLVNSGDLASVGDFKCDAADLFLDKYAAFCKDNKWGFVDTDGNIIIQPKYEEARSFSNGLAAVKKDGKWGFINEQEEFIINPEFFATGYMNSEGKCFVKAQPNDNTWSIISLYYWEKQEVKNDTED